jgi:DNA-directed RNA polymerase subunit omega
MPFLDIEKAIKESNIGSRFRLVHIASQRAREINDNKENTVLPKDPVFSKVTTIALDEIIEHKIDFIEADQDPSE